MGRLDKQLTGLRPYALSVLKSICRKSLEKMRSSFKTRRNLHCLKKSSSQPEERYNMPTGDIQICIKCGKGAFGAMPVCTDCNQTKNYGVAYDMCGQIRAIYADLPTFNKSNTAKNVNLNTEESLDDLYYKMIDQVEKTQSQPNCRCDECECDNDKDITSDDLDDILAELEDELVNQPTLVKEKSESLEQLFDSFFKDETKVSDPVKKEYNLNELMKQFNHLFDKDGNIYPSPAPTPAPVNPLKRKTLENSIKLICDEFYRKIIDVIKHDKM